ncbi:MAG: NAD(+) diphosphatase [Marinilabiliaceae bacterium]|nr:NAD(+) diphosphatase [Marinilabiliaceae bacterium]
MRQFIFINNNIALRESTTDCCLVLPDEKNNITINEDNKSIIINEIDGIATMAVSEETIQSHGLTLHDLRSARTRMTLEDFRDACQAKQILHWHTHSLFCPCCGAPTKRSAHIEKQCPSCNNLIYPPLAPATITLVHKGKDEILMVRAHNFRSNHYGLVAGFVEPGESLEECVSRELMEETRIRVKNIRYAGSQPWPFPCGIMIGFEADYESGEIIKQDSELIDAQWFNRHDLPPLPDGMSIARQLIDKWLK